MFEHSVHFALNLPKVFKGILVKIFLPRSAIRQLSLMFLLKDRKKLWFQFNTKEKQPLTHYRPAMPFGNRKKYFRTGSFKFRIVTIKKISPLWNPEI